MKTKLLITILGLLFAQLGHAEYYKINVKRVERNLYKDTDSGIYIITKHCYEYSYGEEAILKYEKYSYDNKIIFESGDSCDVEKILQ